MRSTTIVILAGFFLVSVSSVHAQAPLAFGVDMSRYESIDANPDEAKEVVLFPREVSRALPRRMETIAPALNHADAPPQATPRMNASVPKKRTSEMITEDAEGNVIERTMVTR